MPLFWTPGRAVLSLNLCGCALDQLLTGTPLTWAVTLLTRFPRCALSRLDSLSLHPTPPGLPEASWSLKKAGSSPPEAPRPWLAHSPARSPEQPATSCRHQQRDSVRTQAKFKLPLPSCRSQKPARYFTLVSEPQLDHGPTLDPFRAV